ncbi:MAG: hypothetical protein H5T69_04145 [Chloroflexi bacterium]|nr:hypothetical protein [Chloroflexota bacterium]
MATAELERPNLSLGPILAACGLIALIALAPGVAIRERADGHAVGSHGTSALEIIRRQRRADLDVWYSRSRETALVIGCDGESGLCGLMVIGVRGHRLDATAFSWADLDRHLEITHFLTAARRVPKIIARDGYIRVWPPAPTDVVPPVWERCTGGAFGASAG